MHAPDHADLPVQLFRGRSVAEFPIQRPASGTAVGRLGQLMVDNLFGPGRMPLPTVSWRPRL